MDSIPARGTACAASFTAPQGTTAGRPPFSPAELPHPSACERGRRQGRRWWAPSLALAGGLVERFGFYFRGRAAAAPGRLPTTYPTVCVQLPMFNEHAVARRVIEAACAMTWPVDRLSVQVLDDSTDHDTRALVDRACAEVGASTGIACHVRRRADRQGYKAGALEAGRRETDAEFIVIFDADFVPPADYLLRALPHFYGPDGKPDTGLALVQTQWGHLNADESPLTRAQPLWVDDHHTLQMSWRSAVWQFVNFTGTAGVWRASAVEAAGGWRAASLVEDCELSFRHLFAGYRTAFVKEIVAPAELPATFTAYKAQQKRWTQGWVQLQRLHLRTLLFGFRCSSVRRVAFAYHMCISWQWPFRALVRFALPSLPEGCTVASATLRVYAASHAEDRMLRALRIAGPWTEGGVTWAGRPATAGTAAVATSGEGYLAFDVTGQVAAGAAHGFEIADKPLDVIAGGEYRRVSRVLAGAV